MTTDVLLGPAARDPLAAVWQQADAQVEATQPTGVTFHPGRSLVVEHTTTVRWPDGTRTHEPMVLARGLRPPDGALVLSGGGESVVAWRVPADPWLPGLAPALDPPTVTALLADLDLPTSGVSCHLRAYRPTRRAVVEVTSERARLFLKVVPPRKAEALHRRHLALHPAVPVPASFGWSPPLGIVVLEALAGRTVRDLLLSDGPLPDPAQLVALLDALPPAIAPDPGIGWRAPEFARHIGALVPGLADRTAALAAGLAPFEAEVAAGPSVPVHGDLYDAQLLVDAGGITGLLDVDTFRTGHRVDDLAVYLGHLVVLATAAPAAAARIDDHARAALACFDRLVSPASLRAAVAGVVLGLATGSFRTQDDGWADHTERRVALAEGWLDHAVQARRR